MDRFIICGKLVDIANRQIFPAELEVQSGQIVSIRKIKPSEELPFLIPGFIDAHVHIESSMLTPAEFARLAVVHGTVATISDPHEIANVCGIEGVNYMIENGLQVPFKFYFGAPSCVPATEFETTGAKIEAKDINDLLQREEIPYLAEMMNWPGTVGRSPEVMEKIAIAKKYGKPVDGHAPGLKGELAAKYASVGITTDHECFTLEEALEKAALGMKIAIREGSAAKNFDALIDIIDKYPGMVMFCSDDKHPDNLALGHINEMVVRAIKKGKNLFDVLEAACITPIHHYNLDVGQLKLSDPADFIVVGDLVEFRVLETYIKGEKVAEKGESLISSKPNRIINNFKISKLEESDFEIMANSEKIRVIDAHDGQLVTSESAARIPIKDGKAHTDLEQDILKIAVVNRYQQSLPAIAFIRNFGIREGAIASSVAHDSHNIIVVGVDDKSICEAVNLVIESKGGISAVSKEKKQILPLPIAGIMSDQEGYKVAKSYTELDQLAKEMGATLASPFMSLSFMALLVIPNLKLSDKGLFDGKNFTFTSLFLK